VVIDFGERTRWLALHAAGARDLARELTTDDATGEYSVHPFCWRYPVRIVLWMFCGVLCLASDGVAQTLRWETVDDIDGATLARAITLSKKAVVVIGNAAAGDFVIHALRRRDGEPLWTDRVPAHSGIATDLQIASAAGRIFAAGYAADANGQGGTDTVIRAYDAATGTLLWNNLWDSGRDDFPNAIVAGPTAVVAAGVGANSLTSPLSFLVRAYDPTTGAVLWEDRQSPGERATATSVAITRTRVFVSGTTTTGNRTTGLLRVYNAATGALEWSLTRREFFTGLAVVGRRLVVFGSYFSLSYLGAFDTRTGAVLWEDSGTEPGGYVGDIAIEGDRLIAVGGASRGLRVQSYDVASGRLEWVERTSVLPGFMEFASSVATNGRVVYIAGANVLDFEYQEIMVRAYDAATGALLWDDRSHRSPRPSTAVDIALDNRRLYVAGFAAASGTNNHDFVIRAYDIRADAARSAPDDR
jgi:outer membrane protein assembly factor BamB